MYHLGAVASLKFLATENVPRSTVTLHIVDYAMRGGRLSWQSYQIIATHLVIIIITIFFFKLLIFLTQNSTDPGVRNKKDHSYSYYYYYFFKYSK